MSGAPPRAEARIRVAARALAGAGLVNAYGHCSERVDADHFLVCAPKAMSTINPGDAGIVVPVRGPLPEGTLGEVRVHQQIYARRGDVGGIVRFLSPRLLSIGAAGIAPRVRHGFGAYFAPAPVLWPDPALLRDDARAAAVAEALGAGAGIILRGNGAVVAGADIVQAVALAWFLEDMTRVELEVRAMGLESASAYTEEQAGARATWHGNVAERLWAHMTRGDPELADCV